MSDTTLLYRTRGVSIHIVETFRCHRRTEGYSILGKDWYLYFTVPNAGVQDTKRFVRFIGWKEPEHILEVVKDKKAGLTVEEQQQVVEKFNEYRLEQALISGE